VANQRSDVHHKAARGLLAFFDTIGVEDLAVKQMARQGRRGRRTAGLNRSIADADWAPFRRTLEWQATKAGEEILVPPAKNTTQRCSDCGTKAEPRLELKDGEFRCRACGLVLGRGHNSARNLHPGRAGPPSAGTGPDGAAVPMGGDGSESTVPVATVAA
jgi:putative transposase